MRQVTKAELEAIVRRINRMTESPMEYSTTVDGKFSANIGHYHLDWAYGGVCLRRTVNTGGGEESVIDGFGTKRELQGKLFAFIRGLETCEA